MLSQVSIKVRARSQLDIYLGPCDTHLHREHVLLCLGPLGASEGLHPQLGHLQLYPVFLSLVYHLPGAYVKIQG